MPTAALATLLFAGVASASIPERSELAPSKLEASEAARVELATDPSSEIALFAGVSLLPKTRVRGFELPAEPRVGGESELSAGAPPGSDESSRETASGLRLGLELDPDLNWYYARNRWYDPETGSFTSADPLGYPDSANPYVWGVGAPWANDPLGLQDPKDEEKPIGNRIVDWIANTRPVRDLRRLFGWINEKVEGTSAVAGAGARHGVNVAVDPGEAINPRNDDLLREGGVDPETARGATWGTQPGRSVKQGLRRDVGDVAEQGAKTGTRQVAWWAITKGAGRVLEEVPVPKAAEPKAFESRPGRPTGRDWADYFRKKYGRENVEWTSLEDLRKKFNRNKEKIIAAWEESHGATWPRTETGEPYIPHHDPALSEGGTIWDIRPMDPAEHRTHHAGGKTVKPEKPFER